MKMAKTSAVFLSLVMVLICFNAPAVVNTDEHPWDQEGGGGSGTLGDTTHTIIGPLTSNGYDPSVGGKWSKSSLPLYFVVSMAYWYHDLPAGVSVLFRGVGGNGIDKVTCTKAK